MIESKTRRVEIVGGVADGRREDVPVGINKLEIPIWTGGHTFGSKLFENTGKKTKDGADIFEDAK